MARLKRSKVEKIPFLSVVVEEILLFKREITS